MSEGRVFSSLKLNEWRQFKEVTIDFHDRLTILTGANGAGKSTLLKILKSHFDGENDNSFIATPIQEGSKTSFSLGQWLKKIIQKAETENEISVGEVVYSDKKVCNFFLPKEQSIIYDLRKVGQQKVCGINISSHRPFAKYEKILSIPVSGVSPKEALDEYIRLQNSYLQHKYYQKTGLNDLANPIYSLKETLISFSIFGRGNADIDPVPELEGLFEKFQSNLKTVLPVEIGFKKLRIQPPEVIVSTSSGDFPIDGASGGLMSLIQLSWQVFLASESFNSNFSVLIDEPENHLHPSMQRTFLSNILIAFPRAQFVVATHSPFIISSVKNSSVYALRHYTSQGGSLMAVEPRSVNSEKLDYVTKAGPASEILREVLGVPVTIPDWSVHELEQIISEFTEQKISAETVINLRSRLEIAGLSEFYPQAIEGILK